jgi:2-polyprenyl-3-methyl-5-hydroxy-6-metoxy-1,4-benzoquinol methylase
MVEWYTGERQMKRSLADVAPNHRARYEWAIDALLKRCPGGHVLDAASGIGYGSRMLADAGFSVLAIDRSPDAETVQQEYFAHPNVRFMLGTLPALPDGDFAAAVSIETVEHIEDAPTWLANLRSRCKWLVASVPNESVVPFGDGKHPYHFRHYTLDEFTDLLRSTGWEPEEWGTQYEKYGPKAAMVPGTDGATLGVVCR